MSPRPVCTLRERKSQGSRPARAAEGAAGRAAEQPRRRGPAHRLPVRVAAAARAAAVLQPGPAARPRGRAVPGGPRDARVRARADVGAFRLGRVPGPLGSRGYSFDPGGQGRVGELTDITVRRYSKF